MPTFPNQENLSFENDSKKVYYYFDSDSKPIYKTKEIFKKEKLFIFYPFTLNRSLGQIKPKKIKTIEFRGWTNIQSLPKDFRTTPGYGFKTPHAKQFFSVLYKKFPKLEKVTLTINGQNRFSSKTISLNWGDFDYILKQLNKEKFLYDRGRKIFTNNLISEITSKVQRVDRNLTAGELETYLGKFDSYEKIAPRDIEALTKIFANIPSSKIMTTAHIIKTKEKIDIIYLEDIITQFERLLKNRDDEEEVWQNFFQDHTWTLNHLFPYEVVLSKGKAFVGGKTIENDGGRIVDFLFQTGFKDNFALLEIKTPRKQLLKRTAYREPAVFSVSDELSGGVNQCLDQKDTFLRDFGLTYKSLDPKTVLVIGQKSNLSSDQATCFELYRANQKNVDVVTFDELHSKLLGLFEVITGRKRKKG